MAILLAEPFRHSRIATALAERFNSVVAGEAVVQSTCSWRGEYIDEAMTEQIAKRDVAVMVETARHNSAVDEHTNLIAQGVAEHLLLVVSGVLKVWPLEHVIVLDVQIVGKSPAIVTLRPRARHMKRKQIENIVVMPVVSALVP